MKLVAAFVGSIVFMAICMLIVGPVEWWKPSCILGSGYGAIGLAIYVGRELARNYEWQTPLRRKESA